MESPGITIRYAEFGDLDVCRRYDYAHVDADEHRFKIRRRELLLAERDGAVVGFLKLDWIWSHIPYLGLITVDVPHRRQGVGRALLSFLENRLRETGRTFLLSSSESMEPEPQAWHRHIGFRDCGVLSGVNDGGGSEVFFRKDL